MRREIHRNSEGVAMGFRDWPAATQPFQVVARLAVCKLRLNSFRVDRHEMKCVVPGLPKRNPGLELANAFSVIHLLISDQKVIGIPTFCAKPLRANQPIIVTLDKGHRDYSVKVFTTLQLSSGLNIT